MPDGDNVKLKVLYINCVEYDYLTATLIEGLTELGHEVVCSHDSNYGRMASPSKIPVIAEAADLIVIGSNRGVDHHLLEDVRNTRIVAVDGSDHAAFEVSEITRLKAVFKRELCGAAQIPEADFIYPLPFAAEKRYFTQSPGKDLLVSFVANMDTNPIRKSIHVRLLNRNHPAIFTGSTDERAYSSALPEPHAIETPRYRQLLARSWISVNAPGAGYDCARYWEILAAGAMLLTYAPDTVIPNGFTDGVNCVTFSSIPEFEEKLDHYLAHPDRVREIAEAGHNHLLAYHTTAHRAAYFLGLAMQAVNRSGFCEPFYAREVVQYPLVAPMIGKRYARRAQSLAKTAVRTWLRPFLGAK